MEVRMVDKLAIVGMNVVDLTQALFVAHSILLMEFVTYQCEEKPHFAEAKKKNPKARRSAANALQHTPDFVEPVTMVQCVDDFSKIRLLIANLKKIEPETTSVASYLDSKDKGQIYIHEALKLISRVRTRNGIFHIPLLDMDIPTDEIPYDLVFPYIKEVSQLLGVSSGVVVNSGKSYHLWGLDLMTVDAWHDFMHRALLLDRIDRRWVGHRLLDGQANLRVSPKWGKMPEVAYVF
ncbi:MAG: hypothetical protein HYT65_01805 [Candidatus Yanofskybacteria bacterium]|nr:hypothetical protein [Candidatus Yanofskybacteria bacterium]